MGLDITGVGSIADLVGNVINKIWPDPAKQAEAALALATLKQSGALAEMIAQTDINKVEAASTSTFVSGWRPAVGWVCVVALVYTFIGQPLLSWYSMWQHISIPPVLDLGTLITLLGGMMGLSGLRTIEKINGVAAK